MGIPWLSLALIVGSFYLIKTGRVLIGSLLIIFTIALNIVIQFIKGGGLDALKRA